MGAQQNLLDYKTIKGILTGKSGQRKKFLHIMMII